MSTIFCMVSLRYLRFMDSGVVFTLGLILGLRPANERRRYKVRASLIGWAQT